MLAITNMLVKMGLQDNITSRILSCCRSKHLTQLEIMYAAYLSDVKCREYLANMVKDGLLRYHDDTKKYNAIEKGLKLLEVS